LPEYLPRSHILRLAGSSPHPGNPRRHVFTRHAFSRIFSVGNDAGIFKSVHQGKCDGDVSTPQRVIFSYAKILDLTLYPKDPKTSAQTIMCLPDQSTPPPWHTKFSKIDAFIEGKWRH
jgi:hypothetical protein